MLSNPSAGLIICSVVGKRGATGRTVANIWREVVCGVLLFKARAGAASAVISESRGNRRLTCALKGAVIVDEVKLDGILLPTGLGKIRVWSINLSLIQQQQKKTRLQTICKLLEHM